MFDGELFGQQMVEVVKGYVERQTAPLIARVAELEARELPAAIEGPRGEKGEPGEPANMEQVREWVAEGVAAAVSALPPPEKGEAGERGEVGPEGKQGADGAAGANGKDAVGIAETLLDGEGNLVLTMTDGRIKTVGRVVGRDGVDGTPGESLTLDDFDIVQTDERTIEMKFVKGDTAHTFQLGFPIVIDRGVWSSEKQYERGDAVSWGGSLWIAQKDAPEKPDTAESGWRLAVKKGRDGRDAK